MPSFQYTITLKPGDSSSTFNYDFSEDVVNRAGELIWMLATRLEHSPWDEEVDAATAASAHESLTRCFSAICDWIGQSMLSGPCSEVTSNAQER